MSEDPDNFRKQLWSPLPRSRYQTPNLQHQFTAINESLHQRSSLESIASQESALRKQKIIRIQHRIQEVVKNCQSQKQALKQKIAGVKQMMAKSSMAMRQRLEKNKSRIGNLKQAVQEQLNKQKCIGDMVTKQIKEEFLLMSDKFNSIQQSTQYLGLLPSSQNALKRVKNDIDTIRETLLVQKQRNQWQPCLTLLEQKVTQWRKGLTTINNQFQQGFIQLQGQISTAKQEIQSELLEETRRRQQNKEKIVTLLQNAQLTSKKSL